MEVHSHGPTWGLTALAVLLTTKTRSQGSGDTPFTPNTCHLPNNKGEQD